MNHLSLFSGIGGLDLAAEWAGFRTAAFVERDPYCQRVLAKRWPDVPIFDDVRTVPDAACLENWGLREPGVPAHPGADDQRRIGLVSGGFPCQPHSVAGKRQASLDDRDLWPEVARVLRAVRPRWFVGENVRGLLHSESGRFFGAILGDLADMGYRVGWGVWGASDVGALHQRERVFIVAHAGREGLHERRLGGDANAEDGNTGRMVADGLSRRPSEEGTDVADAAWHVQSECEARRPERERVGQRGEPSSVAHAHDARLQGTAEAGDAGGEGAGTWEQLAGRHPSDGGWLVEPDVGRVAHGVPSRVDRLRALGNAVVPQQAYPLFKAIAEIENAK